MAQAGQQNDEMETFTVERVHGNETTVNATGFEVTDDGTLMLFDGTPPRTALDDCVAAFSDGQWASVQRETA